MNATLVNPEMVTGRRSVYLWWCRNGHKNAGAERDCGECTGSRVERHAAVHPSERSVIYRNPVSGEISVPGRADDQMHPKLAADGFERVELTSYQEVKALESRGLVHAETTFNGATIPPTIEKDIPEPKSAKELGLLD